MSIQWLREKRLRFYSECYGIEFGCGHVEGNSNHSVTLYSKYASYVERKERIGVAVHSGPYVGKLYIHGDQEAWKGGVHVASRVIRPRMLTYREAWERLGRSLDERIFMDFVNCPIAKYLKKRPSCAEGGVMTTEELKYE